jgi:serine/threonine protein kinase
MFYRIELLHKKGGFIHRDIKLNNFVCSEADNYAHPDTERKLFKRQQTLIKKEVQNNEGSRREVSADVS